MGEKNDREQQAERALSEFMRRIDEGTPPRVEDFLAEQSGLADLLAPRLRGFVQMQADLGLLLGDEPVSEDEEQVVDRLSLTVSKPDRYRILEEIGRGGMGKVYRVWDRALMRTFAMKLLDGEPTESGGPPQLVRFLEEAQVTGQLDHPGIVPVHEIGRRPTGEPYFTMRLVKGRDLKTIFRFVRDQEEGWNVTRALGVLSKACEAVAFAHSKDVVHRDLKPGNIMVGRFGAVYVVDWGLAKVLGQPDRHDLRIRENPHLTLVRSDRSVQAQEDGDSPLFTMDGTIVGTPAYMSLEQARGNVEEVGPQWDVYSMGAILYHLLAGHAPYVEPGRDRSSYTILSRVLGGPPAALSERAPDAPAELVAICERAMARQAQDRYADMQELAQDLSAYMEHRVVRAYETGAVAELRKWVKRNKALAVAIAAGLVALVVGTVTSSVLKASADRNAGLAEARRRDAEERRDDILRLSAFQRLADLVREADEELWPPHPDKVRAYDEWRAQAEELVAGLTSLDGEPGHLAQLEELAARAAPTTSKRSAQPRFAEYVALERRVAALTQARAVYTGQRELEIPALDEDGLPEDHADLIELVWECVDPRRSVYGRELEGLALARMALQQAVDAGSAAKSSEVLAWALLACGQDTEGEREMERAVDLAPPEMRVELEWARQSFYRARAELGPLRGERAMKELQAELARLDQQLSEGTETRPRFEDEDDRWWHAQLTKLVAEIRAFSDPTTGLISGTSPEHGWGIAKRQEVARTIRERSISGAEAAALWNRAIESIADASICPRYEGLRIEPQLGLLPLGRDPQSGLWEFVHLLTGEPPTRNEEGRLELTGETGIVLVLVPGGPFWMGSQADSREHRNYVPKPDPFNEGPVHEVVLSPYLISKYEMTQSQWKRLLGRDPSYYGPGDEQRWVKEYSEWPDLPGELLPVESVNWFECLRTIERVGLTLPTEAQWEYAARAGTSSAWWTGDALEELAGAGNVADQYAERNDIESGLEVAPLSDGNVVHTSVGSYRPNPFGLHDTIGNLQEWCLDGYVQIFYTISPRADPCAPRPPSREHVVRGGSYARSPAQARSAIRSFMVPEERSYDIGLRPARRLTP